jgi:hypothetical protein
MSGLKATELSMWRRRARHETNLKHTVIDNMTVPELRAAVTGRQIENPVPDHEGLDEWVVHVFDTNGDHSEDLLDAEFPIPFIEAVSKAHEFAEENPEMQMRVVIERLC